MKNKLDDETIIECLAGDEICGTNSEEFINWVADRRINDWSESESRLVAAQLLWLLHAPRDLPVFPIVINNLKNNLDSVEDFFVDISFSLLTKQWPVDYKKIKALISHIDKSPLPENLIPKNDIDSSNKRFKHPLRGRLKTHCTYSMLVNSYDDSAKSKYYNILQGMVFLGHAELNASLRRLEKYLTEGLGSKRSQLNSSLYTSSLFFRKVLHHRDSNYTDILNIFEKNKTVRGIYNEITSPVTDTKANKRSDFQKEFSPFFRHWLSERLYDFDEIGYSSKKRKHTRSKSKYHGWYNGFIHYRSGLVKEELDQDPEEAFGSILNGYTATNYIVSVPENNKTCEGDEDNDETVLDDAENTASEDLFIADDPGKTSGRLLLSHQVAHIERANQLLATQWSQATDWEIYRLVRHCDEIIKNISSSKGDPEVAIFLMIMLLTGSKIDEVHTQFRFFDHPTDSPSELQYVINNPSNNSFFRIRTQLPSIKSGFYNPSREFAHPAVEYIDLHDFYGVYNFISSTAERRKHKKHKNKLFNKSKSYYRSGVLQLLKELPYGHRLNEHKISMYLFQKIVNHYSGDVADAILITGRYHPLGQTLLHYTSHSKQRLEDLYKYTFKKILNDLETEGLKITVNQPHTYQESAKGCFEEIENKRNYLATTTNNDNLAPTSVYAYSKSINENSTDTATIILGKGLLPQTEKIHSFVNHLQEKINTNSQITTSNSSLRQYHNDYSVYTWLMISYATGYRAVKNPGIRSGNIDPQTGLAVISDKDGSEMYNSRLVWVPDRVKRQLEEYEAHIEQLLPKLSPFDYEGLRYEALQRLPVVFLLNENLCRQEIRPKSLRTHLENFLPLPANVNRRYLRTTLRAKGCPAEVVDAFMGHWGRAQEPWGKYSTFSNLDFIKTLAPYLEEILDELGFQAIRSGIHNG